MTAPAQRLRKKAFARLDKVDGETVTFRGSSVGAIINRDASRDDQDDRPDFSHRADSMIEFRKSDLTSKPKVGELVTDTNGDYHRIQKLAKITDFTYICEATVETV